MAIAKNAPHIPAQWKLPRTLARKMAQIRRVMWIYCDTGVPPVWIRSNVNFGLAETLPVPHFLHGRDGRVTNYLSVSTHCVVVETKVFPSAVAVAWNSQKPVYGMASDCSPLPASRES